ncbi:MAG: thioesterase family protein, partial [Anderseniella sp.]|nr:thioesterase family protein [Anderseniella sp.]
CDEAFELVGLGEEYLKTGASFFTLETHTSYVRELHAGDQVKVTVQLLDHDAKRMHYVQEMYHAEEGWLSCVLEAICMHVDLKAKKSAPFPDWMQAKIAEMHEAHKGCPVPPQVGHKIGIVRR